MDSLGLRLGLIHKIKTEVELIFYFHISIIFICSTQHKNNDSYHSLPCLTAIRLIGCQSVIHVHVIVKVTLEFGYKTISALVFNRIFGSD